MDELKSLRQSVKYLKINLKDNRARVTYHKNRVAYYENQEVGILAKIAQRNARISELEARQSDERA